MIARRIARLAAALSLFCVAIAEIVPFRPTPSSSQTTVAADLTTNDGSSVRCLFTFEAGSGTPDDTSGTADLSPEEALQKLDRRCFKLHQEQWAYEACVGQTIRQSSGAETFNLGNFARVEGTIQHYDGGDRCDALRNRPPRRAFVQYACGDAARLLSVVERSVCVYELTVVAPELCASSAFADMRGVANNVVVQDEAEPWYLEVAESDDGELECSVQHSDDLRKGGFTMSGLSFANWVLSLQAGQEGDAVRQVKAVDAAARHSGRQPLDLEEAEVTEAMSTVTLQSTPSFKGKLEFARLNAVMRS